MFYSFQKFLFTTFVFICMGVGLNSNTYASDKQSYQDTSNFILGNLHKENFDLLTKYEKKLRSTKQRTPNGEIALGAYFDIFDSQIFPTLHTYQPPGSMFERHLQNWIKAQPDSVTAQLSLAIYYKNHSVQIRKKFGAKSPPDSGLDLAKVNLDASKKTIEKLKNHNISHPHVHVVELQLLMLEGASIEKLIEAHALALSKFPSYFPIHYVVLDELSKRAHYSKMTMAERHLLSSFTRQILDQVEGPFGSESYARLHIRLFQKHLKLRTLSFEDIDFNALQAGLRQIVSQFNTKENRNIAALFSCLSGDRASAKLYWPHTNAEIEKEIWQRPVYFEACKQWLKTPSKEPEL